MSVDSQNAASTSTPRLAQPHGGNIARAAVAYPDAAKPWVDLSTGINPYPWPWPEPLPEIAARSFARLPEPQDQARLEAVAASAYGAPNPAMVVAAPGTQALISLLPRALPGKKVAILSPTYSEHRIAWTHAGAHVDMISTLDQVGDHDVLVAVNPNNPDGRVLPVDSLFEAMRGRGMLVIDEAFADLESRSASMIPHLGQQDAVVMRSFGKSFGLAGLRLGFAVARLDLAQHLRRALGPWAVSGPALDIGSAALADNKWVARMCGQLAADANKLDGVLRRAGFSVVGGTRLFRLARHTDALAIFDRLCQAGILTRKFEDHSDVLRFGIPPKDAWERLEEALRS
jgi:cobalamin biosynthetic protein CobC